MIRRALPALRRRIARLRDESGATAAEFALVVPLFIIVIFSIISGSMMLAAANQLHFATERAARCLSVDVGTTCDDIAAYANSQYHGPALTGLNFVATAPSCGNQVVGTGTFEIIGGLDATDVTISATACYPTI